ncbi:MAG: phosphoglycerate kinase [Verrucomicrobia bacterium]|nr:phosphoglycerate kinase [Verrucomicrobiota bacterium]
MNVQDLPLKDKKVLVRVDFNVPFDKNGEISDDTRIRESLPTIQHILDKGGSVILMSHLGRPEGQRDPKFTLKPCARRLGELLKKEVKMAPDSIGEEVEKIVASLGPKEVLMLENLRFYPAEEKPEKDPEFAKKLAKLGDYYINDAFGTAHRAHSSTATIAQHFKGKSGAGYLLQKEIEFLGRHFGQPKHPFYAIIGGAKVSTKLGVLKSLLSKADALFIGGAMAFTFLKAQGIAIGNSLCEDQLVNEAAQFLSSAKKPIYLPKDLVIAKEFTNDAKQTIVEVSKGIPDGWQGMDIGPETLKLWKEEMGKAKMIFWNGPLGVFEFPNFAKGTRSTAENLANLDAVTIVGGGDSIAAISQMGLTQKFSHLSTGGGACLEYIEFGHLPGIDALN